MTSAGRPIACESEFMMEIAPISCKISSAASVREPELKPLPVNVADYDVIAVGTPTWWYTMAPAVKTFLHGQNFAGKTVVPFMTNGGWPGRVIKDMKAACPGADFACDMQVKFDSNGGDHLETPESKINTWAQSVKALL